MANAATNETTSGDVAVLKEDIQKLRDDLGLLLGDVGSYSKERLADTHDRLSAAIEVFQGRAYGRLKGTARVVQDRSSRAMDVSRGAVEQKPLTYVAAAFVAGAILASFLEWKKTS
ncbi:MAG: hypothetical protein A2Y77_14145 [Planctomycetes bacterium RBG_13_62_9]|nr:MAG: hypothetical protein A2Y77_14145 [Planctomycetes bacterium RBG_13_62_9]